MDISFESFAFKKRQSVLQIESDKEEECDNEEEEERGSSCSTKSWNVSDQEADQLDDSFIQRKSKPSKRVICISDSEEEDQIVQPVKRNRICSDLSESNSTVDNNKPTISMMIESSDDELPIVDISSGKGPSDSNGTVNSYQNGFDQLDGVSLTDSKADTSVWDTPVNTDVDANNQAAINKSFHGSSESEAEVDYLHENHFVFSCFESSTMDELLAMGFTKKKAEKVVSLRPFLDWNDLVNKLQTTRGISDALLETCSDYLKDQEHIDDLLLQCENLSQEIRIKISEIESSMSTAELPIQQPSISNPSMYLKQYQLMGLNWLAMLHERGLNGILADQMGLGKTVQALSFLGHLIENGHEGPHLVVCPCSTADNWVRELSVWLPDVSYLHYTGSQDERFNLRQDYNDGLTDCNIIISSTNTVTSTKEDRKFFRRLKVHYLILDEAHMVKNMKSARYKNLLAVQAERKLLLTGTPLQNDLMELLALLTFLMPDMMAEHTERIQTLFSKRGGQDANQSAYLKVYVEKVKKILRPFVLRRLKRDVLSDMPEKQEKIVQCQLTDLQRTLYNNVLKTYTSLDGDTSGIGMMMKLRKISNHPLLVRHHYTDEKLLKLAKQYCMNPAHFESNPDLVFEDLTVMSDSEIHTLCKNEVYLKEHRLDMDIICDCGKMKELDVLLPKLKSDGHRVLIFSQFVIVLDILQEYLKHRNVRFLRFDGSTKGCDRQDLIDQFNNDNDIFVFLLSTKAGGLGINLTTADTVIFHDLDYNPYNDKQAEDRCHRMGQKRPVTIYKLISKDTIEESILKLGEQKLLLEKKVVGNEDEEIANEEDEVSLSSLLREHVQKSRGYFG